LFWMWMLYHRFVGTQGTHIANSHMLNVFWKFVIVRPTLGICETSSGTECVASMVGCTDKCIHCPLILWLPVKKIIAQSIHSKHNPGAVAQVYELVARDLNCKRISCPSPRRYRRILLAGCERGTSAWSFLHTLMDE